VDYPVARNVTDEGKKEH